LTQLISKRSDHGCLPVEAGQFSRSHGRASRNINRILILADLTMKAGRGLEFIKDARALHGTIPILVVSNAR